MGEYAMFGKERVKIGTCEDMYYLRADQARMVRPEHGSLDPVDRTVQASIRFRFPWPDEDGIAPGAFEAFDRSVALWNVEPLAGVEHGNVQFVAREGYVVSLPCPESAEGRKLADLGIKVHRNGFAGPVAIVQQAYRNGHLALIARCGGCCARYNLPTLADAEPYIVAARAEADRREREHKSGPHRDQPMDGAVAWWHKVAERIAAGYL